MIVGDQSARLFDGHQRNLHGLNELPQQIAGMRPERGEAGDDQRPLRVGKKLQSLLDKRRLGLRG